LPPENVCVFDACAVIALLDAEPGAEVVEALLAEEDLRCVVHVLNVCEVYYHIYRRADKERAAKLPGILESYGFELNDSLAPALWQEAGQLKAEWRRISLADCFALALAIQEKATLVTSDHHELDRLAEANVCAFRFIR
jgi:predicted nucleic acid-binding protein